MLKPANPTDCKRILILTADAGYGHRSAAVAIEAAMRERYVDRCTTTIVNPLREAGAPSILQVLAEERHDWYMQSEPSLYELGYRISDAVAAAALIEQIFSLLLHDPLRGLLDRYQPHVVVSTYPLYLEPLNFVFDRKGDAVPLVNVITDLVAVHTIWFNPRVDLCLVPTEQARQKALRNDVPADRIHVTGLPVHPRFGAETRPPAEIRAELGWKTDLLTVLIVGSRRVANVLEIARLIDRSGLKLQMAIVAGGDEKLHAQLTAQTWRGEVHVYGYVTSMPAMIHASDAVITKAGGLIVSETLACGRPLILSSARGQEAGNLEYVISVGAGDWAPTPADVLATLVRWLAPDDELPKLGARARSRDRLFHTSTLPDDGRSSLAGGLSHAGKILAERTANARRAGRPRAVYEVADLIWQIAQAEPRPSRRELSLRSAARLPLKASAQVSRAIDRLEQELRGVTDSELARLASWCISQIETETELKRIAEALSQRINISG